MLTTLIFDLDDTLYDEADYCRSGFAAVAEHLAQDHGGRADVIFKAFWDEFAAGNRQRVFNKALERLGFAVDQGLIGELVELYRNHRPRLELPADSLEVLERVKGRYRLGLLTDGFMPAQKLKAQALGIEHFFDIIIYTELLGREHWKPSTLGYQKILQHFDEPAGRAAYIADNEAKDFIGPNKLGMVSIKIARPGNLHQGPAPQPQAKAQHELSHISQLPAFLESL